MPLLRPPGGEMSGQLTRFPTVLEPWIFFPLWALSPCSLSNPGCHKTARAFYWGLRQHWAMIYPPTSMSVLIHFTLHLFKETSARGVCASSGCGRLLLPLWFERLNQQFWHLAAQHSLLQVSWAPDNKNTQNSLIYNSKHHRKRLFRASQNANWFLISSWIS